MCFSGSSKKSKKTDQALDDITPTSQTTGQSSSQGTKPTKQSDPESLPPSLSVISSTPPTARKTCESPEPPPKTDETPVVVNVEPEVVPTPQPKPVTKQRERLKQVEQALLRVKVYEEGNPSHVFGAMTVRSSLAGTRQTALDTGIANFGAVNLGKHLITVTLQGQAAKDFDPPTDPVERTLENGDNVEVPIPVTPKPVPKIDVTPELDFKVFVLTDAKTALDVTIKNTGAAQLDLTKLSFGDDKGGQYTIPGAPTWLTKLDPGATTTVPVSFEPKTAGEHLGNLVVDSNGVNSPSVTVQLKVKVFNLKDPAIPEFLASGAETVKVQYTVEDPAAAIKSGTFEVFDKDNKSIWSRPLVADEYKDGRVEISWDGKIGSGSSDYPDDYVTLQFSPYKWKVTVSGSGTISVEKAFKVEAEKIELEPGPKALLKTDKYKDVYDETIPAKDAADAQKLFLKSDSYCLLNNEDQHGNSKDYDLYNTMWGDGPLIPIYAKVLIKDSTGGSKLAPLAWGNAAVIWDFEDTTKSLANLAPKAKAYVQTAQQRWKDNTKPPGDNCPGEKPDDATNDMGGKRTIPGNDRRVLPPSSAYPGSDVDNFPFTVEAASDPRSWCVYSKTNKTVDAVKGKTGIIFRPARMAGDRYKIKAYLDVQKVHFKETGKDITEAIKDSTGIFEVWRQLHVLKIYARDPGTQTNFSHSDVAAYYEKAFIKLVDLSGGMTAMPGTKDTAFRDAINGRSEAILKNYAVIDKDNQSTAAGKAAVAIREWPDFKTAYLAGEVTVLQVQNKVTSEAVFYNAQTNPGTPPTPWSQGQKETHARAQLETAQLNSLFSTWGAANDGDAKNKYHSKASDFAASVTEKACDTMLTAAPGKGIVVFLFDYVNTLPANVQTLNGQALYDSSGTRLVNLHADRGRTAYLQFKPSPSYTPPTTMSQTVAHEIGHQLFLPHTKMEASAKDDLAHDVADYGCLMSYSYDVERKFCGYCLLRLRGWNHHRLSNASPDNVRQPAITVTSAGAFGATAVNATSAERTFTITNSGNAPLIISEIKLASGDVAQFEIKDPPAVPATVAAAGTTTFKLVFKPTEAGDKSVQVSIASNAPGSPKLIPVSSAAKEPAMTVTVDTGGVSPIDFGEVKVGTEVIRTLTITSTGEADLQVGQIEITGQNSFDYELRDDTASNQTLAKDATKTVKLVFKSTLQGDSKLKESRTAGPRLAQVKISSNALDSPKAISVTGTQDLKPVCELSPNPLDFGSLELGKTSASSNLSIKNTGYQEMTMTRIEKSGADKGSFKSGAMGAGDVWTGSAKIAAGGATNIGFMFKPITSLGAKTCTVTVTSNATGSPHTMTLTGTALAPLAVAPSSLAYASTKVGLEAPDQNITMTNNGGAAITVTKIELTGPNADCFVLNGVVGAVWTGSKAVGANGGVDTQAVKFKPVGTPGAKTCTVTITSDAPDSPHTVTLQGTAEAP